MVAQSWVEAHSPPTVKIGESPRLLEYLALNSSPDVDDAVET